MKVTAHTVKIAQRAQVGSKDERDLTEADLKAIQTRKDEQAARLARIAQRQR